MEIPRRHFAVIVPMANEEPDFRPFVEALQRALDGLGEGTVYIVVDRVSKDRTRELCEELSRKDARFVTVWAPENRNVVDAYLRGYREALRQGHDPIIEMDAGLSHDPALLPRFLQALEEGCDCAYGSRFLPGGSIRDSTWKRRFLSKGGTLVANLLLGTGLSDMTSGYQGFRAPIVASFLEHGLLSTGHFYQTELRYLLRRETHREIPISYRAPSPRVSAGSIGNALRVLLHLFLRRVRSDASAIPCRKVVHKAPEKVPSRP